MSEAVRKRWAGRRRWAWLASGIFVVFFTWSAITTDNPFIRVCAWLIVAGQLLFAALFVAGWRLSKRDQKREQPDEAKRTPEN